jgi:Flp pilus assembly protein TadD
MLKDLDQRRQSPSTAGAPADLIPASDKPKSGFFGRLFKFLVLLLIVGGAGIGYLYFEEGGFEGLDVSETLNIIPDFIPIPSRTEQIDYETVRAQEEERERREQLLALTSSQAQPAAVNPSGQQNAGVEIAANTQLVQSAPGGDASFTSSIVESPTAQPEQASAAVESGTNNQFTSFVNSSPAETNETPDPTSPISNQPVANNGIDSSPQGLAQVNQQSSPVPPPPSGVDNEAAAASSVINRPPAETVKNYAQMTPEERDTLAVQYALRLIQDNNTMQAYASLEEHVMQNRYAHQSRETYAKLLVNDGNLLAARNLVESGLQLAPNHPGFKKVKARILIGNGDSAEAVSVLSSRAPPVHEDIEYHELLATAQLASRDFEGAQLSYTSLVRQDQSQGRWWYGLAASNDSLGNRQAALQAYTRAAAQNNLSPNLRRRVQERLAVLGQ